ncbi:MAG: hypothetical protein ACREE9_08270 [Stellaceae bacterium]
MAQSQIETALTLAAGRAGLLRRRLMLSALSAAAAVSALPRALAQQKVPQAEAQYRDRPKNGLSCGACTLFRPPKSCVVVEGEISPNGWCKFFDLPD